MTHLEQEFLRQTAVELVVQALGNGTWWNLYSVEVPDEQHAKILVAVGPNPLTAQYVGIDIHACSAPKASIPCVDPVTEG